MAEKGYYYLKLKENFFESDELKILESMENGYLYSNILLKLYLKALKNDGRLTFNEYIPYNVKMLATITGHNIDITEKALNIFKSMGLIEVLDNGTIYMMNMQQMIGSISSEGVRKAEYREKIKLEKANGTKLGQCPNIISNSNSNLIVNNIEKERINKKEKTIAEQLKEQPDELKPVLLKFLEMRNKIKKPMTDYAFKLLLNKLEKLSNGFEGNKMLILNQSILNVWQDVYELKEVKFSDFKQELVDYAKELANGKGDKYIQAILTSWKQQGIDTVEQAKLSNDLFIKGIGNTYNDKTVIHDRKYSKEEMEGLVCDIDNIDDIDI